MYWGVMCCFFSQVWISSILNSGPLSLLRYLGLLPVHSCVCCKAQMTCDEQNFLPACKQRHPRLYWSHTTNIRAIRPSIIRSCLKSQLQISSTFVAVFTGFSVPLRRFFPVLRLWAWSPYLLRIRATRLWLYVFPADLLYGFAVFFCFSEEAEDFLDAVVFLHG